MGLIFPNFSKALAIPHSVPLNKFPDCERNMSMLCQVMNGIHGRAQRVTVNRGTPGWLPVTSGAPQGAALGQASSVFFSSPVWS